MTEITEIYGSNFIGKTSFTISLLNKDDIVLYIDADNKINNRIELPINTYIYKNNNINDIYDTIKNSISSLDVIVIDSLPNICSDNDMYNLQYDFEIFFIIRKIITLCKEYNCKLYIVNQIRKKNNKIKSFGLRALGLYYTKRIYVKENNIYTVTKNLH